MSVTLRMKSTSWPRDGEPAAEHVEVDRGAHVPDVRLRLHGQPAHVDAGPARGERDEVAGLARRGVVEPQGHRASLGRAVRSSGFGERRRRPGDVTPETCGTFRVIVDRCSDVSRSSPFPCCWPPPSLPVAGAAEEPAARQRATPQVDLTSWSSYADFKAGQRKGLKLGRGQVSLLKARPRTVAGKSYEAGTWTSPWATPGFGATAIIPSWEATTPGRTLVRVELRAQDATGRTGTWDTVADWARTNRPVPRTTYSGQADDLGRVSADTWFADLGRDGVPGARHPDAAEGVEQGRQPRAGRRRRLRRRLGAACHLAARARGGHGPARADVLPDGPHRPLPRPGAAAARRGAPPRRWRWCSPTTASPRRPPASRPVTPTPSSTTPPRWSTTTATAAPATGPSTPPTPPRSPAATPTSPGCATCARPRTTSSPGCRSSSRSPSGATSSPAHPSPPATATCWSSSASRPTATSWSTTPPARPTPTCAASTTARQFERIWIAASGGTAYVVRNS